MQSQQVEGPGRAGCLGALAGVCGRGSLPVLVQAGALLFLSLPGLFGGRVEAGHELDALLQALQSFLLERQLKADLFIFHLERRKTA